MNYEKSCAGIVTVSLWFYSAKHINQIKQSIEILKSLGISKIFVVQDIKTKIPIETFKEENIVEILPSDVFETCQKWYIGLKKAFEEGFNKGFIFAGDLEQYEGEEFLAENSYKHILIQKLSEMLSDPADLIIGDYNVPHKHKNPKHKLSEQGALKFLENFFPNEWKNLHSLEINFPRSEYFIISNNLFDSCLSLKYSKWMPWEATLQLLIYASRHNYQISRHYLGEIGDTNIQRENNYEVINQLLRMQYALIYEYLKYNGYQGTLNSLPDDWLLRLKSSFNIVSNYFVDNFTVTIDGPTATGKSTISRLLAGKLGFLYIDGGIFFRALTLKALNQDINLDDEQRLLDLAKTVSLQLQPASLNEVSAYRVFLDNEDVTTDIWSSLVSSKVPFVSVHKCIREQRKFWIRNLATMHHIIAEGRTLGREIFPNANIKFYLDASLEKRTFRRQQQLKMNGQALRYKEVENAIITRDDSDKKGMIDRLERAVDAIYIDTSYLPIEAVVKILFENIQSVFEAWKSQKQNISSIKII